MLNRTARLIAVIAVLAAMSLVTWAVHNRYWRPAEYRTVAPRVLYVARKLDEDVLMRFRSHFGDLTVVDVRTAAERDADPADDPACLEGGPLALVRRAPLEPGQVPEADDVVAFLQLCSDAANQPIILFAGRLPDGAGDLRLACLEAAYRRAVLLEPINKILADTGLAGCPDETACRHLLETVSGI